MKPSLGHSVELVRALVSKEFSVRYKSTILGFVWSLANPVFFALVFYIAFRHILRVPVENYFAFLLAGLFPWQWFANAVTSSPMVYISNGGLIKKVYFPRILLPMATAGNQLVHFLLALLVSIPILAIQGTYPSIHWALGIPLLLLLQATVILGISILLASLNIFFRDLEHLTAILTNLIFYMTPVFYPESIIPEHYRPLFWFNPMFFLVPLWRNLMFTGAIDWTSVAFAFGHAAVFLVAGLFVLRWLEWRFAESI